LSLEWKDERKGKEGKKKRKKKEKSKRKKTAVAHQKHFIDDISWENKIKPNILNRIR